MGGVICSLPPDHDGPHAPICPLCGEDWIEEPDHCEEIRCSNCDEIYPEAGDGWDGMCGDCTDRPTSDAPDW